MSNFVEKMNLLLSTHNLTLRALSSQINISSSQLSKYASGNYEPSLNNAIKIANYFECSLDYLFGSDDIILRHPILHNPNKEIFKTRLAQLIELRNTNINKISKHTYINRNCIYDWFNSCIIPKMSLLTKLSQELNTTIEYLIGRNDAMEV